MVTLYPDADVMVEPIRDAKGRTLYRAQVVGLQQAQTAMACQLADVQTKSGCKALRPVAAVRTAKR